jgi:hypothetical protein
MGCALKGRGEALPASCDLPDPISGLQAHASGYTSNVDALQNGWAASRQTSCAGTRSAWNGRNARNIRSASRRDGHRVESGDTIPISRKRKGNDANT